MVYECGGEDVADIKRWCVKKHCTMEGIIMKKLFGASLALPLLLL